MEHVSFKCFLCQPLKIFLQNLEAYENRKQIFSTNASRQNPLMQQAKAVTEPPPWSNGSNATNGLPSSELVTCIYFNE